MVLKFTLRMPNCGSWNGRWSGDERSHTVCKTFRRRSDIEKYEKLDKHYFIHDFGDGWRASVRVDIVTAAEAQKARKNSAGFAGYGIRKTHRKRKKVKETKESEPRC